LAQTLNLTIVKNTGFDLEFKPSNSLNIDSETKLISFFFSECKRADLTFSHLILCEFYDQKCKNSNTIQSQITYKSIKRADLIVR